MIPSFADEVVKVAGRTDAIKKLVEKVRKSPMAHSVGRAAGLGAGVSTIQEVVGSDDPRIIRAALAGASGGALTGRMFPGWFTGNNSAAALRHAMKAHR